MKLLNYYPMPEAVIGDDAIADFCRYEGKKIGLVVDRGISGLPCFARVCNEILKDCTYKVLGLVGQEPTMGEIDPLIPQVRDYAPDVIVAIGGGAAIDTAKMLLVFAEKPEWGWDEVTRGPINKNYGLSGRIQLVAVPTTSGTGSEASSCAVLTDYNGGKVVIITNEIGPRKAILDFKLLETLPKKVIAYSGLDALSHVMGALTCNDILSLPAKMNGTQVAVTILHNLEKSFNGDLTARAVMHCAAFKAGETTKNTSCGLDHNLDRFAKELKLPHGYVSGLLLLYTTNYLIPHKNYVELAEQMGFDGQNDEEKQKKLLDYMFAMYKRMGVPLSLKEYGVAEEDYIPHIDRFIEEDKQVGTMYTVCHPTDEELRHLYLQFYYGMEEK